MAPVDVLDVPEDGAQLLLTEHVGAFVTLPDVALGTGSGGQVPPQPHHTAKGLTSQLILVHPQLQARRPVSAKQGSMPRMPVAV